MTKLVAQPVVSLFREPDAETEQVSQGLLGMPVAELEERPRWRRVRTPDGYEGWTPAEGLCEPPEGWDEPPCEVDDLWINLRGAPDYRRAAAAHAPVGVRLPLVDREEGWVRLLLPDGRRLWTEANRVWDLELGPARPSTVRAACRTALRFLGIPYLWGGCSPLGIDCSGFVQLVLRLHGVEVLRDAHQQAGQGEPAPQPEGGDLVFFGPEEQPERITHVGMLLSPRRFVHAAGSSRVRINRLTDAPYGRQLRCARRFFHGTKGEPEGLGALP